MWGAKDVGLGQGHSAMAPLVRLVRRGAMCYLDFRRPNGKHHGAYNLAYALLFGTFLGEPDKGAVHLWDSLMSHVRHSGVLMRVQRFHVRPAVSCASGGLMRIRQSHARPAVSCAPGGLTCVQRSHVRPAVSCGALLSTFLALAVRVRARNLVPVLLFVDELQGVLLFMRAQSHQLLDGGFHDHRWMLSTVVISH